MRGSEALWEVEVGSKVKSETWNSPNPDVANAPSFARLCVSGALVSGLHTLGARGEPARRSGAEGHDARARVGGTAISSTGAAYSSDEACRSPTPLADFPAHEVTQVTARRKETAA